METIHTGLGASSEDKADRFYVDILGLKKSEPKILDKTLCQSLFGINEKLLMIHYRGENVHYEIFVYQEYMAPRNQVAHSCLKITDSTKIVDKCKHAGVKVIEVPKDSGIVTFVSDHDGNLFEIKKG